LITKIHIQSVQFDAHDCSDNGFVHFELFVSHPRKADGLLDMRGIGRILKEKVKFGVKARDWIATALALESFPDLIGKKLRGLGGHSGWAQKVGFPPKSEKRKGGSWAGKMGKGRGLKGGIIGNGRRAGHERNGFNNGNGVNRILRVGCADGDTSEALEQNGDVYKHGSITNRVDLGG
jgi:hypothetical protein